MVRVGRYGFDDAEASSSVRARFLRRLRSALLRYVFGLVVRGGSGARSVSRSSRATVSDDGGCARTVAWWSPCARFFDFLDDDDGVAVVVVVEGGTAASRRRAAAASSSSRVVFFERSAFVPNIADDVIVARKCASSASALASTRRPELRRSCSASWRAKAARFAAATAMPEYFDVLIARAGPRVWLSMNECLRRVMFAGLA